MKRVVLVRHAHAVDGAEAPDDFSRRLRGKGRRTAAAMATWYRALDPCVDLLLSSPAERALETATIFAGVLGIRPDAIRTDPRLYDVASPDDFLDILLDLDDAHAAVLVFGHNPAFTSFARAFVAGFAGFDEDMPKCSVVAATSRRRSWSALRLGEARLDVFQTPHGLDVRGGAR